MTDETKGISRRGLFQGTAGAAVLAGAAAGGGLGLFGSATPARAARAANEVAPGELDELLRLLVLRPVGRDPASSACRRCAS